MFGNATQYERFMGRWSQLVAPRLLDLAPVPEPARVLDVGSGTGSLAFAIAARNLHAQIVGIDPSKDYVDFANSKNSFPGRVTFQVGDAQQLPFPDASFDACLSLLVFNFIPDPKKALFQLRRVTKPGGRISAAVWDYGADMKMLRIFWDAAVSIDANAAKLDEKHMPLCRAGQLKDLWIQSGLTAIHEQPIDITMQFQSFADYWDPFLLGQGPAGAYVRRLDPNQLQALRVAVKRSLSLSREDTRFSLSARVWAVHGRVSAAA